MTDLTVITKEVDNQFADPAVAKSLIASVFKGLTVENAKKAALEGMIRGFKLKDFLEKNVYAIPFGQNYSLVTSIDYARKIGMRSGVIGKSAPSYEYDSAGKIVSCTITIKRKVGDEIGEFTATCFFNEYSTGINLWKTKEHMMIAKVTESHALRMACPEEMSQVYVEEEMQKEKVIVQATSTTVNPETYREKLEKAQTEEQLKKIWAEMPAEAKLALNGRKEEIKATISKPKKAKAGENTEVSE